MSKSAVSPIAAAADLGRQALAGTDLAALLLRAGELVAEYLNVSHSSILELLPDGAARFQAGVGWKPGVVGRMTAELGSLSSAAEVIRTQAALVVSDVQHDPRIHASPLLQEHGIVSSLLVPILGPSRPLGVLGAHATEPRDFSPDQIAWLQVTANILAGRIERERLPPREHDAQLLRAEQMMAIGQVAAGVAHELRNPLTSIKGLVQVNLRERQEQGLPVEDLAVIEHEIRRMQTTLQTFLDFARPPQPDRRWLDLRTVVDRVLALVGGRARKQQVALRLLGGEGPVDAEVDQDQIQQLLLNLVLNALDALAHGGAIEIELLPPRDGFVTLAIRDNGPGIASHILPKVFETFVSSKETGVGLGLPLSRRIAEDHGGSLTAYNLPAGGACFVVRLPSPTRPPVST